MVASRKCEVKMLDYISHAFVVAVKVFKKTTPNGKITVYLGKRDFIDHVDYCDPVDGVVVVDTEYLKGRKVYSQVPDLESAVIVKFQCSGQKIVRTDLRDIKFIQTSECSGRYARPFLSVTRQPFYV